MKIAYLDLNYPDHFEDYSLFPKRYGGGSIFARWAKEYLNGQEYNDTFHIYADENCFDNINSEEDLYCYELDWSSREAIRNGAPVSNYIKEDYDLFVTHHIEIHLNTDKPQCCWSLGWREQLHPQNKHLLLYNDFQDPIIRNEAVIHNVQIGKPIPSFKEHKKEDFIFQCSRHTSVFGSIEVAHFSRATGIPFYFGGPIDKGYPILDYVDNKSVFYLGVMDESDKIDWTKRARLYAMKHNWPTPFNLSAIEALSYGTPIVCNNIGFWPTLIEDGVNGYFGDLESAWEKSKSVSQKDCYDSAANYSVKNMINSFRQTFETICKRQF